MLLKNILFKFLFKLLNIQEKTLYLLVVIKTTEFFMKKIILSTLLSSFLFYNQKFTQHVCGTYDGYLQDEMKKYPEFYNSILERNLNLEKKCKHLVSNLNEKKKTQERKNYSCSGTHYSRFWK